MAALNRASIASAIARCDHLRGGSLSSAPGYKEWTYFYVAAQELELLLAFVLSERRGPVGPGARTARLITLFRDREGEWDGGVDQIQPADVDARGGRIDLQMGESGLRFRNGAYEIRMQLEDRPLFAELRLRPKTLPAIGTSVRLGAAEPMRWVVVPRLEADGTLLRRGRRILLRAEPAYHDHNWGTFDWGGDFSWEWAAVIPSSEIPWTVVYSRIADRARLRVLSQTLLVWRHDAYARIFRDDEIAVEISGLSRGGPRLRIPRVMSLAIAGETADVPRHLCASAASEHDRIELQLSTEDYAQIAIPNEVGDLDATLLCETRATARVRGRVRGEALDFRAPAFLELNQGTGLGPTSARRGAAS